MDSIRDNASLLTHMTLEVVKSKDGELQVVISQHCSQALEPVELTHIQYAIENAFYELLASLPDNACPRNRARKRV